VAVLARRQPVRRAQLARAERGGDRAADLAPDVPAPLTIGGGARASDALSFGRGRLREMARWVVIAIGLVAACGTGGGDTPAPPRGDVFVASDVTQQELIAAAYAHRDWNASADLKLAAPPGWDVKYDDKTWSLVKRRRNERETDRGAFTIEIASPLTPRTAAGLIAHRQQLDDDGVKLPVTRTAPLPDGVLVEFDEQIPHDPEPRYEFIAVRRLGDRLLKCDSIFFLDAADRDTAETICLGASR
jgi:hypothetical protein